MIYFKKVSINFDKHNKNKNKRKILKKGQEIERAKQL